MYQNNWTHAPKSLVPVAHCLQQAFISKRNGSSGLHGAANVHIRNWRTLEGLIFHGKETLVTHKEKLAQISPHPPGNLPLLRRIVKRIGTRFAKIYLRNSIQIMPHRVNVVRGSDGGPIHINFFFSDVCRFENKILLDVYMREKLLMHEKNWSWILWFALGQ